MFGCPYVDFQGQSSTDQKLPDKYFPLVSGADVGVPGSSARYHPTQPFAFHQLPVSPESSVFRKWESSQESGSQCREYMTGFSEK